MEFGLLGPLLVRRGGEVVAVPQAKQRTVLAALLLSSGQVVAADELTAALWVRAARVGPGHRAELREAAAPDPRRRRRSRILTQPRGYLIQVDPASWTSPGSRRCSAPPERGAGRRGGTPAPRAPGGTGPVARRAAGRRRAPTAPRPRGARGWPSCGCRRWRPASRPTCTWAATPEVIAELRGLAARTRCASSCTPSSCSPCTGHGRRAEALDAYRRARQVLVGELAIEPGAGLRPCTSRCWPATPP